MSIFIPAPPAKTSLGRYRLLSSRAGVHVSPLQLGAMNIGDKWHVHGMGSMNKESSFQLLDAYYESGGNFIDTANLYQDETSEEFIGEWAEQRGVRDQMFIATKYTGDFTRARDNVKQKIMYAGNSSKSLLLSVEASLKKLRTTYIDLLYVHLWDWDTSIEEVIHSLHSFVLQHKVLYLGISDAPAWVVSRANQYARDHALTPFVVYQGAWNILERSFEREIIPMARAEGMALAPWNVLAAGKLRTDEEEERRRQTGEGGRTAFKPNWERNEKEKAVSKALEKIAAEVGAKHITSVAIAYVMHKAAYVFPIIGGRKVEHLLANIEALDISLSADQIKQLESVVPFDPGFPNTMIGDGSTTSYFLKCSGNIDDKPAVTPVSHAQQKNHISQLFFATMTLFNFPPPPKSSLGRYRVLSSRAGVHVSPLQLGAASIGDKWHAQGMGSMDKESSFKLLDAYYDLGGNFIDTANFYQEESSEEFIGEWAEERGIRDQLFLATKYTGNFVASRDDVKQKIMYAGNNSKSLHLSVEASLKKLRTTYIDLLYIHVWDWDTSIEELMQSLHTLVLQRKVFYLGASDTPAWVVAKANQYAKDHALTPFVIYQGAWNIMDRAFEREIIPMARAEGMALAPWNILAGGKIRTDAEEERRRQTGEGGRTAFQPNGKWERNEKEREVSKGLEKVANEIGAKSITSVAIAYLMHKTPYVFPIVGGRKVEHLLANIEAVDISLTEDQIKFLEGLVPIDLGFPTAMIGDGTAPSPFFRSSGIVENKPLLAPAESAGIKAGETVWLTSIAKVPPLSSYSSSTSNVGLPLSTPSEIFSWALSGAVLKGSKWHAIGWGSMDKDSSFTLLDEYYDLGGNFIDTANFYQEETSEEFIGEWAEQREIRDQMFIATKYSFSYALYRDNIKQKVMYTGNNTKSLNLSVEASLKKLRTTYLDLLYVHFWDWDTSIEEVMHSLHALVVQRKVYYLGISDTPAWVVARANQYARDHALTPFVVYQGSWNIMDRAFEREIIPMARAEGMALAPWNVLAAGRIRSDADEEERRQTGEGGRRYQTDGKWERNERERNVCEGLEKVAGEIGAQSITSIAIAYLMHKAPYVFPIVGGRKVEHLLANIEALDISLSADQMKYLDDLVPFDPGFPTSMIGDGTTSGEFLRLSGEVENKPLLSPVPHRANNPS
ncbi:hypothetical protein CVT24_008475 [Panaeolus cyanescens]|uniref:NADP-dependent oxidoreductase domain-containing protein n=1 Tax=Panaeolus cyanescens TaxID=181874 RepID=A0A409VDW9_9AGAR|nr:hypothetical protein CVT24_008475 [Panaeolus cyanescens]